MVYLGRGVVCGGVAAVVTPAPTNVASLCARWGRCVSQREPAHSALPPQRDAPRVDGLLMSLPCVTLLLQWRRQSHACAEGCRWVGKVRPPVFGLARGWLGHACVRALGVRVLVSLPPAHCEKKQHKSM